MIALRGILNTLRREPRCTSKEANVAAGQLVELLRRPGTVDLPAPDATSQERQPESERAAINTCLCLSALSRHRGIERRHWSALADVTLPLLPTLPARQLTLALNALSRASAAPASSPWLQAAAQAMCSPGRGALSGQDLLLALSAFARALYAEEGLVLRLVRDDALPMVQELNGKSIAGVVQSSVRLMEASLGAGRREGDLAAHTAKLLKSAASSIVAKQGTFFGPPNRKAAFDRFGSTEVALLLDALSRGPAQSLGPSLEVEAALALAAAALPEHGSSLRPQEVTMVFMALSRLGGIPAGKADPDVIVAALLQAFERVWKQLPGDELSMVLNASAQLLLPLESVWSLDQPSNQELLLRRAGETDLEHHILMISAFTKLNLEVPSVFWEDLISRYGPQEVATCKDGARLLLSAARSDYRSRRLFSLARLWLGAWNGNDVAVRSAGLERLSAMSTEELGANLYARLHWFYQDLPSIDILLWHLAARRTMETTQALELQALMLLTSLALDSRLDGFSLQSCQLLQRLEADVSALDLWHQGARKRSSDLQLQVEQSLRVLRQPGHIAAEVPVGPFVVDLVSCTNPVSSRE